jgi:hypothetical protein
VASQLSKRGAVVVGLLATACGLPPILIGSGVLAPNPADPNTPAWVAICAGLLFVVAGLAIILDYGIAGGMGPDGDFRPGTPFAIRLANFLLGMTIVGLMVAVFGWVAFGSGPRRFSSTISMPFVNQRWASGELSGRVVFGGATMLMAAMWVCCTLVGIERLRRARKQPVDSLAAREGN